ncbi:MAG: FAD-dependent oxidoreductase [Ignavibacteriae bacterium HGW-Ignavibacteriae-4]|jgi:hypothetical protein|nr:MAG: FAD-dependent oxidoreductase [Ignavibacteriae bacterium HGW-Ignavibacteriae-4]
MGFKSFTIKMPTDYTEDTLRYSIGKMISTTEFEYSIDKKSLDGRQKNNIHWLIKISVSSKAIKGGEEFDSPELDIPKVNTDKLAIVVGSGPAGFYSAYVLRKAGFRVRLIEQGPEVFQRIKDVKLFHKKRILNERSNYAFGEGGAGTFSDGKLTSRTKTIKLERNFIFNEYIEAGAPEEIRYLSKPHIGSNLLVRTAKNLRMKFIDLGGEMLFDTEMTDINLNDGIVTSIETNKGQMEADYFVIATGHSSYPVYEMLIKAGVVFQTKPFAIGNRVEHTQDIINSAQWRTKELPGVKAADYALTFNDASNPVYTFCMCPGGNVVSAPPTHGVNLVNGMSNYKRNYPFANSAIVAGLDLKKQLGREVQPLEALDWVMNLERKFYNYVDGYDAPAVKVADFINGKTTSIFPESSYPFDLRTADMADLLPANIINSQKEALRKFNKQMKGFDQGILMGLESRTSSPIQADRSREGLCDGFINLYFVGEGSGFSGGIVSSGADGIKAAIDIARKEA